MPKIETTVVALSDSHGRSTRLTSPRAGWSSSAPLGLRRSPHRHMATRFRDVAHRRVGQPMASIDEHRMAREAKLDELHEKLTEAVDQLVSGEDWAKALAFAAQFRSRSFNNTLLIWIQHTAAHEAGLVPDPMPTYVAGYKQWQQLGHQVEKGQPGYQILAPVTGRFASPTPANPASWRRLNRSEKPRPGEQVRSKMVGVRPAYVWDAAQTSGKPIPTPPRPKLLQGEAPSGLRVGIVQQIEAAGFRVHGVAHASLIHGANGVTDYGEKKVSVRENMDPAAQVKTLAHELAHVLMHGPDQGDARQHRGIGEVEAESVALMIGAAHGMDTTGYTIPYVSTWAARVDGEEPTKVVRATGERVRATAMKILDQLDTPMTGDGTPPGLERESTRRSSPVAERAGASSPPKATAAALQVALTDVRGLQ